MCAYDIIPDIVKSSMCMTTGHPPTKGHNLKQGIQGKQHLTVRKLMRFCTAKSTRCVFSSTNELGVLFSVS